MPVKVQHLATPSVQKLGCAKGFIHRVEVKDDVTLVQQKLPWLPLSVKKAVTADLVHLLNSDVTEKIDASLWVSPIVVTKKKNVDTRMCVDLLVPNKAVIIDSYPLPHMEDLFAEKQGTTVFSTIDLVSAYHQVLLHDESRDLRAFIPHNGFFRFRLSAFQNMMFSLLQNI